MIRTSLTLLCLLAMAATGSAQEDPFGAPLPRPVEPAASAAATKRGGKTGAGEAVVERQPLVIELIRNSDPKTPKQLLQAAQMAFQYGRPDEAKRYLSALAAGKANDEDLSSLAAPSADFLVQLTDSAALQPEGRQVAELILAASQRVLQAEEPINAAIAQLSSTDPGAQRQAIRTLVAAGPATINPLLKALADKNREKEHPQIRSAMASLGNIVEQPLIAVLNTADEDLQMQAIAVLARMGSKRAIPSLLPLYLNNSSPAAVKQLAGAALGRLSGAPPNREEAAVLLRNLADQHLRGDLTTEQRLNETVTLALGWNAAEKKIVSATLPRADAARLLAYQMVDSLYVIKPVDPAIRRLKLLTTLEKLKLEVGMGQPFASTNSIISQLHAKPADVSRVLQDAMRMDRIPAAIAAAEVLGQMGDSRVLHTNGGATPLADAMTSTDRRVRLAAALAAVKLDPGGSFPGAGLVGPTLARFVKTSGKPLILVGHPRGEEAQALVTFFGPLGFEGEGLYGGKLVAERAFENPDVEFFLIADAIDGPPVEELVQWLRRDFRTAGLPIGVMVRGERLEVLEEFFRADKLVTAFPRIHSPEVAAGVINDLQAIAGRNLIGSDERLNQAQQALEALHTIASRESSLATYDLFRLEPALIEALHQPALLSSAAAVLARLGTPTAQLALLDVASQANRPIADRQAAAAAFASAVKLRGLRLTQAQVLQQYDRYNASAALDPATQLLMGGILDTIENQSTRSE